MSDSVTLYFDAESIREHFAGSQTDRDGDLDGLTDEALQQAGEVITNRLSDLFWEAVDDLYQQALGLARYPNG